MEMNVAEVALATALAIIVLPVEGVDTDTITVKKNQHCE